MVITFASGDMHGLWIIDYNIAWSSKSVQVFRTRYPGLYATCQLVCPLSIFFFFGLLQYIIKNLKEINLFFK